jgi:hypothetical protein
MAFPFFGEIISALSNNGQNSDDLVELRWDEFDRSLRWDRPKKELVVLIVGSQSLQVQKWMD